MRFEDLSQLVRASLHSLALETESMCLLSARLSWWISISWNPNFERLPGKIFYRSKMKRTEAILGDLESIVSKCGEHLAEALYNQLRGFLGGFKELLKNLKEKR